MATTAIWPVKGWIGQVIRYVENQEKTQLRNWAPDELQGLRDVMEYAVQPSKTEDSCFVTGINCDPAIAQQEMILIKKQWGKEKGITAYHGYQSFKPGEVNPEQAHEIGVRMAREMWGDKYQVVVATHLDKDHLHNHFVVNSVSFMDGRKWGNTFTDYYRDMRGISDRLCREFGLSVVNQPVPGAARSYKEWLDEKEGRPTWRELIRQDIDEALGRSVSWTQFFCNLRESGYEVKTGGKHLALRPPGKERFVRLRSLGDDYSEEALRRRILQHKDVPNKPPQYKLLPVRKRHVVYTRRKTIRLKGYRALYFHYLYKMGVLTRHPQAMNRRTHFLLREDLRKLDRITAEFKLLNTHRIETLPQLHAYRYSVREKMDTLYAQRREINTRKRQNTDEKELHILSGKSISINTKLKACRKELALCSEIEDRSRIMAEKLRNVRSDEKQPKQKQRTKQKSNERG